MEFNASYHYENPRGTLIRKPHGTAHIGDFIRHFGPIINADTDSFESSHKKYTTSVWKGTSKRLGTLVKKVTTASVIHLKFYKTLQRQDGITKCQEAFGPKNVGDGLVIKTFTNVCNIRFIATSVIYTDGKTNVLIGVGPYSDLFDINLFGHNSLPSIKKLSYYLKSCYIKIHIWQLSNFILFLAIKLCQFFCFTYSINSTEYQISKSRPKRSSICKVQEIS